MNHEEIAALREFLTSALTAFNGGDVDKFLTFFHEDYTYFYIRNSVLNLMPSREQLQGLYDAGLKPNVSLRHLEIAVYGDTAVPTGYITGTFQQPDGSVLEGTWRYSATIIKSGGAWKIVHNHWSPLMPLHERRAT